MPERAAATIVFSMLLILFVAPVAANPPARDGSAVNGVAARASFARPAGLPAPGAASSDDPVAELGRVLFFDPRLSGSNILACATCHNPGFSWGDGLPRAVGHGMQTLARRTPTLLNVGFGSSFFWDGRAATLEEQALGPIAAPGEMNLELGAMEAKLRAIPGYAPLFARAFPGQPIDAALVAKALAAFERRIVSGEAPFDAWLAGDEGAISAEAKLGFEIFAGKGNCATCHSTWRFSDDSFYDIGASSADIGRGSVLPGISGIQFAFKTPTLRNVALRGPYLHDGSEATLADVIELYDQGGRTKRSTLSMEIKPLGLTAPEKRALVAFLGTLSSVDPPVAIPSLPR